MPAASAAAYLRRRRRLEATINLRFSQRSRSINWKLISHRRRPAGPPGELGASICRRAVVSLPTKPGRRRRRLRSTAAQQPPRATVSAGGRASFRAVCVPDTYLAACSDARKWPGIHFSQATANQPTTAIDLGGLVSQSFNSAFVLQHALAGQQMKRETQLC